MNIIEDFTEPYGKESRIEILDATYIGRHHIEIAFNDGLKKVINFKPFLERSTHPSVKKYLDENLLQTFSIINGNLNWNDYELIFPVHELYEDNI